MTANQTSHPIRRCNALTGDWIFVSSHRAQRSWEGQLEAVREPVAGPGVSSLQKKGTVNKLPLLFLASFLVCGVAAAQTVVDQWLFDDGTSLTNTSNSGANNTAWTLAPADSSVSGGRFELTGSASGGATASYGSPQPLAGTVRFEIVFSEWDFSDFSTGTNSQRVFSFTATDSGGARLARIQMVYDNGALSITADQGLGSFRTLGSLSVTGATPTTVWVSLDLDTEAATYSVSGEINNSFSGVTTTDSRTDDVKSYQIGRYGSGAFDQGGAYLRVDSITLKAGELPTAISVHPLFKDNAVLQRDKVIPIWGRAGAGQEISVLLDGVVVGTGTADAEENWSINIGPFPGDGGVAHRLELSSPDLNSVILNGVVFGDVYILSGQSNMDWKLKDAYFPPSELAEAELTLIRQIRTGYVASTNELTEPDPITAWVPSSPATASNFTSEYSAVGYYFAKHLHLATGEPVGLLFSAWGGQLIERFLSPQGYESVPTLSGLLQEAEEGGLVEHYDIFNARIAPLAPYGIRGVLWYQGEANANSFRDRNIYDYKLRALARGWRKHWGGDDFSFHIAQLPNFSTPASWPEMREAQRSSRTEPNFNLAVLIDVGDDGNIHPINKLDPGARLAKLALAKDIRQNIDYSGPLFHEAVVEGNHIRVIFDHAESGLYVGTKSFVDPVVEVAGPLQNFEIAGSDKNFISADAVIDGDTVVVSSPSVTNPVYVRYGYSSAPTGGNKLYNRADLPASPFNTYRTYELDVLSGSGDVVGVEPATVHAITADAPDAGFVFDRWIGPAGVAQDVNAASTDVTMPEHDVYIFASYRPLGASTYTVAVVDGSGDGDAQAGSIINIKADAPGPNQTFEQWTGDTAGLINSHAAETTFRMPTNHVTLTATYRAIDSVGDGIPDRWRAEHFGGDGTTNSSLSLATADPDEDRADNYEEYQSGTDPNDSGSVFTIDYAGVNGSVVGLRFKANTGRRYQIQSSPDFHPASWTPVVRTIVGDGLTKSMSVEASGNPTEFIRGGSAVDAYDTPPGLSSDR